MRTDPRIRQSLNNLSTTLDSAADTARTGCFHFTSHYIEPCISCVTSCLPARPHHRRHPTDDSTHPFFGFYEYDSDPESYSPDYYEGESRGGFLGAWGNGELDRLLAGSSAPASSAGGGRSHPQMTYGSSRTAAAPGIARRKSTLQGNVQDPTVIPASSMFGFLSRFGVRGRGMRYKPSAANLQEHPVRGGNIIDDAGGTDGSDRDDRRTGPGATRNGGRRRSGSGTSADTGDSLRSRHDLWPSEDEEGDAVMLADEALLLSASSGGEGEAEESPHLGLREEELRAEEERIEREEEAEVERKRRAAKRLAVKRGLSLQDVAEAPETDASAEHERDPAPVQVEKSKKQDEARPTTADSAKTVKTEEPNTPTPTMKQHPPLPLPKSEATPDVPAAIPPPPPPPLKSLPPHPATKSTHIPDTGVGDDGADEELD